jgi:hypothetical protein
MASMNQPTFLKISAIAVAAPRYAGALAAAVGIDAIAKYPLLIPAEVIAGFAMAVLEGWAMAYVFGKWRLLKPCTVHWWTLLILAVLLALTLPLVSAPYLVAMQSEMTINELFNSNSWQFAWSFIVAAVPVLIVMAVGVASQDEQERKQRAAKVKQTNNLLSAKQEQTVEQDIFACEFCSEQFGSIKALNGHKAHCKVKQNGSKQKVREQNNEQHVS